MRFLHLFVFLVFISIVSIYEAQKFHSFSTHIYLEKESFTMKMLKGGARLFVNKEKVLKMDKNFKEEKPAKIPLSVQSQVLIDEKVFSGRKIFEISPKKTTPKKTIVFLHGGAYVHNIFRPHWQFVKTICLENNIRILVVDYPLLPNYTADDALKFMENLLVSGIIKTEEYFLMGDSAGGGLALSLTQQLSKTNVKVPSALILLAPWLDVSLMNPSIQPMAKNDVTLSVSPLRKLGEQWSTGDLNAPTASPIYGNFSELPTIYTFVGTHDILFPDCELLHQKLTSSNKSNHLFLYPKLPHDFMILTFIKESKVVRKELKRILK
jgi:monoterpene epsilon-lactone hydrolase